MKNINSIFASLLCCVIYFYSALAIASSNQEEAKNLQKKHLSSYKSVFFQSSLQQSEVEEGMARLGPEELPLPTLGQIYKNDIATGTFVLNQTTIIPLPHVLTALTVYTSNESGKINYLSSGDNRQQESFAYTVIDTYKGVRKYPLKAYKFKFKTLAGTLLSFDRGHGIDHADGNKESSLILENYTPQVSFYNQHIRNPLVGHIRQKEGTYKEISIFDDEPAHIDGGTRLPIGFVFMEFYNHKKEKAYYFPNLIAYKAVEGEDGDILEGYQEFCNFFEINDEGAFKNSLIKENATEEHTRAVHEHSWTGYRTLSGRFQIIPEEHGGIPRDAQIALHKMLAVHHLQQAGELEFKGIEEKAELVRTFSSHFKYVTFDRDDPKKEAARQRKSAEFLKALASVGISEEEYFYGLSLANPEKLNPDAQKKHKKMIQIQKQYDLTEEEEEGEDLYDLEKAHYWLSRIEEQLSEQKGVSEEKQLLCELYQIPELRNKNIIKKEKDLRNILISSKEL